MRSDALSTYATLTSLGVSEPASVMCTAHESHTAQVISQPSREIIISPGVWTGSYQSASWTVTTEKK